MAVPLLDLTRQYAPLREEILGVIDELCTSQRFILGQAVADFEKESAQVLEVEHAVGVTSGTDALLIALMALGIGRGDEVIVPTFTFFATAGVVHRVGATPVFVDVDPIDYCLPADQVREAISPKTKAIIPVHLFGQAADMDALTAVAGGIPIIEDCAQAWGADFEGQQVGSMGLMGAFSFFPSKNLGCFGDGGLVTTNDTKVAGVLRELRMHGQSGPYLHPRVGGNFRIDALQAEILRVKMSHVGDWIEGRRRNAKRYSELFSEAGLGDVIELPVALEGRGHTFNQYVVRAPKRDELRAHLNEKGIGCGVYYPLCLHLQPCFADLGYREGQLPLSEKASREVLALPVFGELRDEELVEVVKGIAAFYL
jgi:dTDP-4-amino-4,6-dideoxygalactose transaminase